MSYGIKWMSDAGTVLIDNTYANYALIDRGTLSGVGTYTITSDGTAPVLAWSGDGVLASHTLTTLSGSTWTFTLQVLTGGSLSWFVFDLPRDLAPNYGRRVRDVNGRVTYDSRYRYMNVVDTLTLISTNSPTDTQDTTRSMTSGRMYAVTNSGAALSRAVVLGPPVNNNGQITVAWNAVDCAWAASGNLGSWRALRYTTRSYAGNGISGSAPSNVNLRSSFIAFDVTNY